MGKNPKEKFSTFGSRTAKRVSEDSSSLYLFTSAHLITLPYHDATIQPLSIIFRSRLPTSLRIAQSLNTSNPTISYGPRYPCPAYVFY